VGQRMLEVVDLLFTIGPLVMIDDGVGGDAEEPGGERSAAPFIGGEVGESFVEGFRGEVFGGGAVVHATDDEEVDAIEMQLVENIEFRRVGLRCFDEQALVGAWRRGFLCRTSGGHHDPAYSNCREA
jgi:hypothetical protein